MKKITEYEDLKNILTKETIMPSSKLVTEGYGDLSFKCGCGKSHGINSPDIDKIGCATPVKFIFKCDKKDVVSMVRVKGIFKQECFTEWCCSQKLYTNVLIRGMLKKD